MPEKEVNYSEEATATLVAAYEATPTRETVEALAEEFGKSFRSVVAKLSREGVYVAQPRVSKDGSPVVRKEQLVESIEKMLSVEAPSLVKASKQDLRNLVDALVNEQVERALDEVDIAPSSD